MTKTTPFASFLSLPTELIVKIFTYLNGNDVTAVREVCSRFLDAALYFRLTKNLAVNVHNVQLASGQEPAQLLLDSPYAYPRLIFEKCNFENCEDFFRQYSDQIVHLELHSCPIRKEKLIQNLYSLDRLESLEIDDCNEIFKDWREIDWDLFGFVLPNLRKLTIRHITYISQAALVTLMEMAPFLETFEFLDCLRECHDASARIKAIDAIVGLLSGDDRAAHIRQVSFIGTPISDESLLQLSEIQNLHLKGFGMSFVGYLTNPGLYNLLHNQHGITELDFTGSAHLLDPVMRIICKGMPQLKVLKLRNCIRIGDNGIEEIVRLTNLEVLDLHGCENITDYGLSPGLFGILPIHKKLHVRELYLGGNPNISEFLVVKAIVEFPKITVLDLSSSSNCVTNQTLQAINKYLTNLVSLNLECCLKFTDAGVTGIGIDEANIESFEGTYSIRRLKALRSLNMSGCTNISDASLMDFAFLELKELSLAWCHAITERGVRYLATHCPSLDTVDFTGCYGINDLGVDYICAHLKRLRTLKLVGCTKLTNKSLDSIAVHCKKLKDIHIRGCNNIGGDAEKILANLPCLRNIHFRSFV